MSLDFSPDGSQLVSGAYDNTVKMWDVQNRKLLYTFEHNLLQSVAYSPDGKYLASASGDRTVKVCLLFPPVKKWLLTNVLPYQAHLISRAFEAKKPGKDFVIKAGTDDANTWVTFPKNVRDYLQSKLNIKLSR